MEIIKTVLFNYAVCSLIGGMLEHIAPEKFKKTLRIVVVSILLFMLVAPLSKTEINLNNSNELNDDSNYNLTYDALMHTANLLERKIKAEVKEILMNLNINEYEIYVTTSIDENSKTVFLEEIKIEIEQSDKSKIEGISVSIPEAYKKVLKVGVKNG